MKSSFTFRVVLLALTMAVMLGCSATKQAARSEIELDINRLAETGKLSIRSPKDVDLSDIRVIKNGSNYTVTIGRYRAVVSEAAVEAGKAEVAARQATYSELIGMVRVLAEKAAASQGVPMAPSGPAPGVRAGPPGDHGGAPAVTTLTGPDGIAYKVLVRNGVLTLVPVDDVAQPQVP